MNDNITSKLFTIQYTETLNGEVKEFNFSSVAAGGVINIPSTAVYIVDWGYVDDGGDRLVCCGAELIDVPDHAPPYVTNFYNFFHSCGALEGKNVATWDMSKATVLQSMFYECGNFIGDVSNWDVSNVINMRSLFYWCKSFNQDLSKWNVSNVKYMDMMFYGCTIFNSRIGSWDVSNVKNMEYMFLGAESFNQSLSKWDVSNVKYMDYMFLGAKSFNQDLSPWDVHLITKKPAGFDDNATNWELPRPIWGTEGKPFIDDSIEKGFIKYRKELGGEIFKYEINTTDNTVLPVGTVEIVNWGTLDEVIDSSVRLGKEILKVPDHGPSWTTNYGYMFKGSIDFNDPSVIGWDVSHVTNMFSMFYNCKVFNQDIGKWDVSNVETMDEMFYKVLVFDQDLSGWNVEKIKKFSCTFSDADITNVYFNGKRWSISKFPVWGTNGGKVVSKENTVIHILEMYGGKKNKVTFEYSESTLSEDRYFLNTSAVIIDWGYLSEDNKHLCEVEAGRVFVLSERLLQVPKVRPEGFTNFSGFFNSKPLLNDPNISKWDIKGVKYINDMFEGCTSFNQPLNEWDVSDVLWFSGLFRGCTDFNQDIGMWDVSNGENFYETFKDASSFNQDLSYWNVVINDDENIEDFDDGADSWVLPRPTWQGSDKIHPSIEEKRRLKHSIQYHKESDDEIYFHEISLDGDTVMPEDAVEIVSWGELNEIIDKGVRLSKLTLKVPDHGPSWTTNYAHMFKDSESFNDSNVVNWDVSHVTDMDYMFSNCKLFDQPLDKWDVSNVTNMVGMFRGAKSFNQDLSDWDVKHIPEEPTDFSEGTVVWTLPKPLWGVELVDESIEKGFIKCRDKDGIVKRVAINLNDDTKLPKYIVEVINWGYLDEMIHIPIRLRGEIVKVPPVPPKWTSNFGYMFSSSRYFNDPNVTLWDVSHVTDMNNMFRGARIFNQPLNNWDVSNVVNMERILMEAFEFNQPLNDWDVSNVTNMEGTFNNCHTFDQPLDKWDVSNVENMESMFVSARSFNQDISMWNVSKVEYFSSMFMSARSFNQDLSSWNVKHIPSKPTWFDEDAISWVLPRPRWGEVVVDKSVETGFIKYCKEVSGERFLYEIKEGHNQLPEEAVHIYNWGTSDKNNVTLQMSPKVLTVPDRIPPYITKLDMFFKDCVVFSDSNISKWITGGITSMKATFRNTKMLDVDLSSWNVSNVTDMTEMFMDSNIKN